MNRVWLRFTPVLFASLVAFSLPACSLRESLVVEAPGSPVVLRAARVPPGAEELGLVEVSGDRLDLLLQNFGHQVAELGGNYGKIDDIHLRFNDVRESTVDTKACGDIPYCGDGALERTRERAETVITGRAFRVKQ